MCSSYLRAASRLRVFAARVHADLAVPQEMHVPKLLGRGWKPYCYTRPYNDSHILAACAFQRRTAFIRIESILHSRSSLSSKRCSKLKYAAEEHNPGRTSIIDGKFRRTCHATQARVSGGAGAQLGLQASVRCRPGSWPLGFIHFSSAQAMFLGTAR